MIDVLIWVMGFSILIIPVLLFVSTTLLTWFTPESVIDRYLRPPYFSDFEAIAYRYFSSSWVRTLLFSMAVSIPFFRRVRGFGDMNKHVPLWFNIACRVFVYGVLGYVYSFCIALAIFVAVAKFGIEV